eukprot:45341_1
MATVLDTSNNSAEGNAALVYLHEQNVALNSEQIKLFHEMEFTLEDLCNMSIETDFAELCQELNLSFAPKIKLKSAIIKLQSKQKKQVSSPQSTKLEILISMGFDEEAAVTALNANDNDIVKSVQSLTAQKLSHHDVDRENSDEKHVHVESDDAIYENPSVETLVSMGFNAQNSIVALKRNNDDIHEAIETLTSGNISSTSPPISSSRDMCIEKMTIALIGNSGVGKSSILTRFMDNTFDEQRVETLGVDHREKEMNIIDTVVKLRVLDTAGQERFQSICSWYYRISNAFIVVYDITNKQSFLDLERWLNQVNERA